MMGLVIVTILVLVGMEVVIIKTVTKVIAAVVIVVITGRL